VSLLWRKSTKVLIEPAGISIAPAGGKAVYLENNKHADSPEQCWHQLVSLLEQNKSQLLKQKVKFVLSPHFACTNVMPWRDNIFKSADWQAIAQSHYFSVYGNDGESKKINVLTQGFAKPVLYMATNSTWVSQLEGLAAEAGFELDSITSQFNDVSAQFKRRIGANDWLLLVSDNYLVLATRYQSNWQQFSVASPIDTQSEAVRLVNRAMALQQHKPKKLHIIGVEQDGLASLREQVQLNVLMLPHHKKISTKGLRHAG
jgi:hypothetical protein